EYTDAYVKIAFVNRGVDVGELAQPLTLDSFNALPAEQRPTVRTYTVRDVDTERREISIDFVVHGQHGVAGPWAAAATPGQPAYLMGPSGAYAPDPAADWHLFAGVEARWIYRGGRADLVAEDLAGDNAPLIAAVKEANWLPGQVQVFIHGEAQTVMHNLRPYIRKERGVDAKWAA